MKSRMNRTGLPPAMLAKLETLTGDRRTPDAAAIRWEDIPRLREALRLATPIDSGVVAVTARTFPAPPGGATVWRPWDGPVATVLGRAAAVDVNALAADPATFTLTVRPLDMRPTYSAAGAATFGWTASFMPIWVRDTGAMALDLLFQGYANGPISGVNAHSLAWTVHRIG